MNWNGSGRKQSCLNLNQYSGIILEGLRKATKEISDRIVVVSAK
jgi:hypothetical protein